MNELARHIASLLQENDCVIIPDFGGFIAHYIPAQQTEGEKFFLPPTRAIGFNPQLRINDGLLAQSYMSAYGSSFPDAVKTIQKQSEEVVSSIHETGYIELDNVGELRYDIYGKYEFTPYDHRLATPDLYGLDSFEMKELADLQFTSITLQDHAEPAIQQETKTIAFSKYLRNVAAAAAILIFVIGSFFIYQTNDKVDIYNAEAGVFPKEILKESLAISSIVTHQPTTTSKTTDIMNEGAISSPISDAADAKKLYHVIVASVGNEESAQAEALRLVGQGFPNAKAIIGDGKARVCVESFEKETDAYRAIQQFQTKGQFDAAWVLRK